MKPEAIIFDAGYGNAVYVKFWGEGSPSPSLEHYPTLRAARAALRARGWKWARKDADADADVLAVYK